MKAQKNPRDRWRPCALEMLRDARYAVLKNSEDWHSLICVLEKLSRLFANGSSLRNRLKDLGDSEEVGSYLSNQEKNNYDCLCEVVCGDRNDAVHEGASARKFVDRLLEFSGLIELAIIRAMPNRVRTYMVSNVVVAELWHPLRWVRQSMLNNSFSWIPIRKDDEWYLISDYNVGKILNSKQPNSVLDQTLEELWSVLQARKAIRACPDDDIKELDCSPERGPTMIFERDGYPDRLVGVITAFDLL